MAKIIVFISLVLQLRRQWKKVFSVNTLFPQAFSKTTHEGLFLLNKVRCGVFLPPQSDKRQEDQNTGLLFETQGACWWHARYPWSTEGRGGATETPPACTLPITYLSAEFWNLVKNGRWMPRVSDCSWLRPQPRIALKVMLYN